MKKIFISPSSQEANTYTTGTNEETVMNLIADSLIPELVRHGVGVMRNNRNNTYAGHISQSNGYGPDLHLAIHSDASGGINTGKARGCTVFCYDPSDPSKIGTQFAEKIYKNISALTPTEDRGVRSGKASISEIKYTHAPAALVEIAFHDNPDDAQWIVNHISQIAHGLLLAILEQFSIPSQPTNINETHIAELNRLTALFQKEIDSLV